MEVKMNKKLFAGVVAALGMAALVAVPTASVSARGGKDNAPKSYKTTDDGCVVSIEGDEDTYTSLKDAIYFAEEGDTLTIEGTCNVSAPITVDEKLTITSGNSEDEDGNRDWDIVFNAGKNNGYSVFLMSKGSAGSVITDLYVNYQGTGNGGAYAGYGSAFVEIGSTFKGDSENIVKITGNHFDGGMIDGDTSTYSAVSGLFIHSNSDSKYIEFTDNIVYGVQYGVYAHAGSDLKIDGNIFYGMTYSGVKLDPSAEKYAGENIEITNNEFYYVGEAGSEDIDKASGVYVGEHADGVKIAENFFSMTDVTGQHAININSKNEGTIEISDNSRDLYYADASGIEEAELALGEKLSIKIEPSENEDDIEKLKDYTDDIEFLGFSSILINNGQITDLKGNKLTLTLWNTELMDLDEVEEGFTRVYRVLRLHDGVVEELDGELVIDTDVFGYTYYGIKFESDLFSTYALGYTDVPDEEAPEAPNTGYASTVDGSSAAGLSAMVMGLFGAIVAAGASIVKFIKR